MSASFSLRTIESALGGVDWFRNRIAEIVSLRLPSEQNWNCSICTFENTAKSIKCSMCSAVKSSLCTLICSTESPIEVIDLAIEDTNNEHLALPLHTPSREEANASEPDIFEINLYQPIIAILTGKRLGLIQKKSKATRTVVADVKINHEGKSILFTDADDDDATDLGHDENSAILLPSKRKATSQGTVNRAGKSRFVSPDGDFTCVEEMVKVRLKINLHTIASFNLNISCI